MVIFRLWSLAVHELMAPVEDSTARLVGVEHAGIAVINEITENHTITMSMVSYMGIDSG